MAAHQSPITTASSVAALVPHFRCEEWLGDCLQSLVDQSRPLDAIVVIDDASDVPPVEIVRRFPGVTLLTAAENVGPYRLIQTVIASTAYDAYLMQDADDWSMPDRLAELLTTAEREGAELVGSQVLCTMSERGDAKFVTYPFDVNEALRSDPVRSPLVHPSSLVARALADRIGGFAGGLRFSGDTELLRRAAYAGRLVNSPRYLYCHRVRPGSLTTSPETGLRSQARARLRAQLRERARANAARAARGEAPDLAPYAPAGPVALRHVVGPTLQSRTPGGSAIGPRRPAQPVPSRTVSAVPRPVFVFGAPGSGQTLLAIALAQHSEFVLLADSGRRPRLAELAWIASRGDDSLPSGARGEWHGLARALGEQFDATVRAGVDPADGSGQRWVDVGQDWANVDDKDLLMLPGLSDLFPEARFVFVVRDPRDVLPLVIGRALDHQPGLVPDGLVDEWIRRAHLALAAEAALESDAVIRVQHRDLIEHPASALEGLFAHLGARAEDRCCWPMRGVGASRPASPPAGDAPSPAWLADERLDALRSLLLTSDRRSVAADALIRARLRRAFLRHVEGAGPSVTERLRDLVAAGVPTEATVAVITDGDPDLLEMGDRRAWHYPAGADGSYAGHPSDGPDAVAALERLCAQGAGYLVMPAAALWWLAYYTALAEHLEQHAQVAGWRQDTGLVLALGRGLHGAPRGWLRALTSPAGIEK